MMRFFMTLVGCAAVFTAMPVQAATLFSQTPDSNLSALPSDLTAGTDGSRVADDFSVTQAATARSVIWRGVFDAPPSFPMTFDLTFYADESDLPGAVVSTTSVAFSADEIIDTGADLLGTNVYEFRADITPTQLSPDVDYWFSPLAETTAENDDDNWYWLSSSAHDLAAWQADVTGEGAWAATAYGPNYFVLSSTTIPEPGTLSLLVLSALMMCGRRRHGSVATSFTS